MRSLLLILLALTVAIVGAFLLGKSSTKAQAQGAPHAQTVVASQNQSGGVTAQTVNGAQAATAAQPAAEAKPFAPRIIDTLTRAEKTTLKGMSKAIMDKTNAFALAHAIPSAPEQCYMANIEPGPVAVQCAADGKLWQLTPDGGIGVYPAFALTFGADGKMSAAPLPGKVTSAP